MKKISNDRLEELVGQANWETEELQQEAVDDIVENRLQELIYEECGIDELIDDLIKRLDECRSY